MKLKKGDKVKFLNESGGGIVSKIIDSRMVSVEIDDGFDIPTLISELVKVNDDTNETESFSDVEVQEEYSPSASSFTPSENENRKSKLSVFTNAQKDIPGVYLAFAPHDQQWLMTGKLDVFVVNNTPYNIMYTLSLPSDSGFTTKDHDSIGKEMKVLVDTIDRDDLDKWQHGFAQILFWQETSNTILMPANSEFKVKGSRFYKEGNYRMSNMINEKALLVSLLEIKNQKNAAYIMEKQEGSDEINSDAATISTEAPMIDKYKVGPKEAEVDLHIGEIVDNILGLSNTDMLNIQLEHFHKTLTSAMENEYSKVTFIHGVGNGVLKNRIMTALKDYEGLKNKSASMSKFGVGAIDVIISYF
ncbi:MAG: DUF2027 domain-containing protein [Hyphomicrobiales bacterium]